MKIQLSEFSGVAPKLADTALAEDLAQEATNVDFEAGVLTGASVKAVPNSDFGVLPARVTSVAKPTASKALLAFTTRSKGVAVANLLAPSDSWGRVYFLSYREDVGKYRAMYTVEQNYTPGSVTVDPVSYALGMSKPWYPPAIAGVEIDKSAFAAPPPGPDEELPPAEPDIELDYQITAYVYTLVDTYGHEGVPSAPTENIALPYNAPFKVNFVFQFQPVGQTDITSGFRRLYRAAFGGGASRWQFVADIPWSQLTYTDELPLGMESEELISMDWAEPPSMEDFVVVNGAFLACFEGNRVHYSEFKLPHAWPEANCFSLPHDIVGIKSTLGGLFVGTKGVPFWASGSDPSSAIPVNLGANLPCVSAESIVDMGDFVVYASQDGLVAANPAGAQVITTEFMDRVSWLRDFNPGGIRAFAHEGGYYFSSSSGDWWVFTPGGRGLRKITLANILPSAVKQVFYDAERDTTFVLRTDGTVLDIVSGQDESLDFKWTSKTFRTSPTAFSTAQVLSTVYPVLLHVVADGEVREYTVESEAPLRLAAIGYHTRWALGVSADAPARIMRIAVSQSPSELYT